MYSVRFHLQHGPHYKHWQIRDLKDKDCAPTYINPLKCQLIMLDCTLVCNEKKAKRVFDAGRKDVCGWIQCGHVYVNDLDIFDSANTDNLPRLRFNPIVDTCWRLDGYDESFNNKYVDSVITSGGRCYLDVPCCVT